MRFGRLRFDVFALTVPPTPGASTPASATASPTPQPVISAAHVALDVASSFAILALSALAVILLAGIAWRLFIWLSQKATASRGPLAGFTEDQIRAIQSNAVLGSLLSLVLLGVIWLPLDPVLQPDGKWIAGEFIEIGVMLTAGFFGFLFGLPHFNAPTPASGTQPVGKPPTNDTSAAPSRFLPSTNLEKVADSVATLIAGAALAQVVTAPSYIARFSSFFADNLHLNNAGRPLGAGILLFFGPLGFVLAYVATRTIGARAFARSDTALVNTGSRVVEQLPVLPDVQSVPTPDQRAIAVRIASMSLAAFDKPSDKITWARAQAILDNWKAAETAYQQVLVIDDSDPSITLEYATVLYNDLAYLDYSYILALVDRVLELLDKQDDSKLRSRALALRAGTNLYVPGGSYIETIVTANEVIRKPDLQASRTLRFYRACAFGQLYRGYLEAKQITAGDADSLAIQRIVERDVAITLTFGAGYKDQLQVVIDPEVRKRLGHLSVDDDLQQLAIDDPALPKMCGLEDKPSPPSPDTKPEGLALPLAFTSIPAFVDACPI